MYRALLITSLLLIVSFASACQSHEDTGTPMVPPKVVGQVVPTGHGAAKGGPATPTGSDRVGVVLETFESGGYTYVHVDAASGAFWAAGPAGKSQASVGQKVRVPQPQMVQKNFKSPTTNREFESIDFVTHIMPDSGGGDAAGGAHHPGDGHDHAPAASDQAAGETSAGPPKPTKIDVEGLPEVEGSKTIAEVFAGTAELAGKPIVLRGKVVKWNPKIMGRNWIHIQDGTGEAGKHDLTITTQDTVNVGDAVVVRGTLSLDRDFGGGYAYPVIVEEARVELLKP